MRWSLVPVVLVVGFLSTVPPQALADGRGVVTRHGRVGPLKVGRSTETAVRRFAGRPTRVSAGVGEGGVPLRSFRYRCGQGCNTLFYFDGDGRLANFITRSRRYHTANGTRVGQHQDRAEEQEHKTARSGPCSADYGISRRGRANLYVGIDKSLGRVDVLTVAGSNSVLGC